MLINYAWCPRSGLYMKQEKKWKLENNPRDIVQHPFPPYAMEEYTIRSVGQGVVSCLFDFNNDIISVQVFSHSEVNTRIFQQLFGTEDVLKP